MRLPAAHCHLGIACGRRQFLGLTMTPPAGFSDETHATVCREKMWYEKKTWKEKYRVSFRRRGVCGDTSEHAPGRRTFGSGEHTEVLFEEIVTSDRRGQGPRRVTVSIGAACYSPGESPKDLLRRADRALYHAKNTGEAIAFGSISKWQMGSPLTVTLRQEGRVYTLDLPVTIYSSARKTERSLHLSKGTGLRQTS